LADYRDHGGPRAGGNSLHDPQKMRWRFTAHTLIYRYARQAGLGPEDPHMQRYARELFLLARQCGTAGLATESRQLFGLAQEASGSARSKQLDFRLYRVAAACIGWPAVARLACWLDRWRSAPFGRHAEPGAPLRDQACDPLKNARE